MQKKKIFVTGGLGFIGHRLVKRLLKEGHEVVAFDLVHTYTDPAESNFSKIIELRKQSIEGDFKLIRGDIRNEFELYEAVRDTRPDAIVHLAGIPIASIAANYHEDAINNNLKGTIAALEMTRRVDSVKHFVFASSSMVYGDFVSEPVTEEDPCNPIELYGATKYCGETLIKAFHHMYGIPYTIVRPSAVNGPGGINRSVLQLFCQQAIHGRPITVKGGENTRLDFTHVDDLAEGFALILENKKSHNQIFNITKGNANTLSELVSFLKEKFPHLEVNEQKNEMRMPKRGTLSIEKAQKLIGYSPKHTMKDCVESYIDFYRKVIE